MSIWLEKFQYIEQKRVYGRGSPIYPLLWPKIPPNIKNRHGKLSVPAGLIGQKLLFYAVFRLFEVSCEQAFKCFAMASLIAGHFMNGIVDCIKPELFSKLCKLKFTHCCAIFSINTHFEVLFGGVG